jgi:cephalosporin hydroxylase
VSAPPVPSIQDAYEERTARWSDIVEYLPLLYGYARAYGEGVRVLEVGTRLGNSTLAFLAAAEKMNGHVWSVDIDKTVPSRPDGMGPYADSPLWTFTTGSSIDPAVLARQPAEVDIMFNDSGHEYDLTLAELRAYMPRLRPHGTALIHDPDFAYDHYGVRRALNVYCAQEHLTWQHLPGQYGLAVITLDA